MVNGLPPGAPGIVETADGLRLTGQRVRTEVTTGVVLSQWLQASAESGVDVRVVETGGLPAAGLRTGHRMHVVLGPPGGLRCGEVWAVAVEGAVSLREATAALLSWPDLAAEAAHLLASGER